MATFFLAGNMLGRVEDIEDGQVFPSTETPLHLFDCRGNELMLSLAFSKLFLMENAGLTNEQAHAILTAPASGDSDD